MRAGLRPQFALWLVGIELSPVFLRELAKAVAAGKRKKALAAFKANATSASVLERQSGFGSNALTSSESPQLPVSKRKAEELSSSDGSYEPSNRRPAPGHLFSDGPASQGSTGELAAEGSRQLGPAEGGLAYVAVVTGRAGPPRERHKPVATGSVHSRAHVRASVVASLMAPLQKPMWPLIMSFPLVRGNIISPSTSQGSRTRVAL